MLLRSIFFDTKSGADAAHFYTGFNIKAHGQAFQQACAQGIACARGVDQSFDLRSRHGNIRLSFWEIRQPPSPRVETT